MARKRKEVAFDYLPFMPGLIAETVAGEKYEGLEWSLQLRNSFTIERIEGLRQKMTSEQVKEFGDLCELRCRYAYETKRDWFMDIVKARGNKGLESLYMCSRHWLASYLTNPETFRERMAWINKLRKATHPKESQRIAQFPELTEQDNKIIDAARKLGYAGYFPAIPSAEAQAKKTLNAAKAYLAEVADSVC